MKQLFYYYSYTFNINKKWAEDMVVNETLSQT